MIRSMRVFRSSIAAVVWFAVFLGVVLAFMGPLHDIYVAIEAGVQMRVGITLTVAITLATIVAAVSFRLMSERTAPASTRVTVAAASGEPIPAMGR